MRILRFSFESTSVYQYGQGFAIADRTLRRIFYVFDAACRFCSRKAPVLSLALQRFRT